MEDSVSTYPSPALLCREWGIRPLKGLGQNFLAREDILRDMAGFFSVPEAGFALEIGPGLGHLSYTLAEAGYEVLALEIDENLKPLLEDLSRQQEKIRFLFGDARERDWEKLLPRERVTALFGNLPYYLSTEFFCKSFVEASACSWIVLLLQKEAAQRLTAKAGNKLYGPASILASLYGSLERVRQIPASAFYPPPTVLSSLVFFKGGGPLQKMPRELREAFFSFLRQAFSMRRKTLSNNLKDSKWGECLGRNSVLASALAARRAEEIPPLDFYQLFLDLEEQQA